MPPAFDAVLANDTDTEAILGSSSASVPVMTRSGLEVTNAHSTVSKMGVTLEPVHTHPTMRTPLSVFRLVGACYSPRACRRALARP